MTQRLEAALTPADRPPPEAPREWRPNPGPQLQFLASSAREVLYGGAGGGGKTDALLIGSLRDVEKPGYAALLLRRTVPQLRMAGGLLERAWKLYPGVGGTPHQGGLTWTWEGGGRIDLASMDHDQDRFSYSGAEFTRISFDELTQFTERQYTFMFSRLRSAHGHLTYMRAGTNPGGDGTEWVMNRWAPWLRVTDSTYSGQRARPNEELCYRFDEQKNKHVRCRPQHPEAFSRTFIPSSFRDTPQLDPREYMASLGMLDPVTRAQILHGNWLARPARGTMFNRAWFTRDRGQLLDVMPREGLVHRVRIWDLAATAKKESDTISPAATAGVRMSLFRDGSIVIDDVRREWARPAGVRTLIHDTCIADDAIDGVRTEVIIALDPGQASVDQSATYAELLRAHEVRFMREHGDKIERAKPLSAACENRIVKLFNGAWVEEWIREAEDFPIGHLKDQVDAASNGYMRLLPYARSLGTPPPPPPANTRPREPRITVHGRGGGF